MAATTQSGGLVIEDMNGPLGYWGPAPATRTTSLTLSEQSLLFRLRDRLEQSGTVRLNDLLNDLLGETKPAAAV
jgi:hypothetical protein